MQTWSWGLTPSLRSAAPAAAAGALITSAISSADPFLKRFSGPAGWCPLRPLASPVAGMLASEASVPSANATRVAIGRHINTCRRQPSSVAGRQRSHAMIDAAHGSHRSNRGLAQNDIQEYSTTLGPQGRRWGFQEALTGSG